MRDFLIDFARSPRVRPIFIDWGVRLQHRIDDWPRLFDIVFGGTKRKDAPGSESKVISLEERAKVTEALKAILDEGGSRLSATDIVRLKAGWETQSCEVGLTPAPLVICPTHTIFYKTEE